MPQPLLQGVETDEHAIGGQKDVVMPAIARALPGELQRVDEDESCGTAGAEFVKDERVSRQADDIGERAGVERHGGPVNRGPPARW